MPMASMGSLDTGQLPDQRLSKLAMWYPEPLTAGLLLSGPNTPHGGSKIPITSLLRMLHSPSPHDVTGALSYISRTLHMGRGSFANEVCTAGVVSCVMQHARSGCDTSLRIPAFLVLNSIAKCGKSAGRSALAVAGAVDIALSALADVFDLPACPSLVNRSSARSVQTPVPDLAALDNTETQHASEEHTCSNAFESACHTVYKPVPGSHADSAARLPAESAPDDKVEAVHEVLCGPASPASDALPPPTGVTSRTVLDSKDRSSLKDEVAAVLSRIIHEVSCLSSIDHNAAHPGLHDIEHAVAEQTQHANCVNADVCAPHTEAEDTCNSSNNPDHVHMQETADANDAEAVKNECHKDVVGAPALVATTGRGSVSPSAASLVHAAQQIASMTGSASLNSLVGVISQSASISCAEGEAHTVEEITPAAADIGLEAVRLLGWMTVDASTVHRVCSRAAIHYLVSVLQHEAILRARPQIVKEAAAALRRLSRDALVAARVVNEHALLAALPPSLLSSNEYVHRETVRLMDQLALHPGVRHKIEAVLGVCVSSFTAMLAHATPASWQLLVQKLQGQLPNNTIVRAPIGMEEPCGLELQELQALQASAAFALASACDCVPLEDGPLPASLSVRTDDLCTGSEPNPVSCQGKGTDSHLPVAESLDRAALCLGAFHPMDTWLCVHPPSPPFSAATARSHITSVSSLPSPLWSGTTQADQRFSRSCSSTNSPSAVYLYPCHTSRSLPTPRAPVSQATPIGEHSPDDTDPSVSHVTVSPRTTPHRSHDLPISETGSYNGEGSAQRCGSGRLPVLQEAQAGMNPTSESASPHPAPTISRHDIPPLPKLSCRTVLPAVTMCERRCPVGAYGDNGSFVTSEPSSAVQSARTAVAETVADDTTADVENRAVVSEEKFEHDVPDQSRPAPDADAVELSTLTIGALRRELSLSAATARFSERTRSSSQSGRVCSQTMHADESDPCPPVRVTRSALLSSASPALRPDLVPWPADPNSWLLGLGSAIGVAPHNDSSHSSWHSPRAANKGVSVSMNWLADSFSAASRHSSPLTHHRQSALLSSINFQGSIQAHSPCQIGSVLPSVQSFCAPCHFTSTLDDAANLHTAHGAFLFSSQFISLGTEGESATLYATARSSVRHLSLDATHLTSFPDSVRLPPRIKTKTWRPTPPPSPKAPEPSPEPPRRFGDLPARLSALCYPSVWCGKHQPLSACGSSVSETQSSDSKASSCAESKDTDEREKAADCETGSAHSKQDSAVVRDNSSSRKGALLLKLRVKSLSGRSLTSVKSSPTRAASDLGSATRRAAWRKFLKRQQSRLLRSKSRNVEVEGALAAAV